MGVLGNIKHEAFAQDVHRRMLAGERRGRARTAAYRATVYTGSAHVADAALAPNARRLADQKDVSARIQELGDFAAKLAGIDKNWALVKLKGMTEANLDDYLSPPDGSGARFFDLSGVPRDKIGLLSELQIEDETVLANDSDTRRILKTKLKLYDPIAALRLMSDIAGWKAPEKHEHSVTNIQERLDAAIARDRETAQSAAKTSA